METKSKLRKELLVKRREFAKTPKKNAKDCEIFKELATLEQFKNADLVLSYVSTEIEVDTIRIIEHCFENKIQVAVPGIVRESACFDWEMRFFHIWQSPKTSPHFRGTGFIRHFTQKYSLIHKVLPAFSEQKHEKICTAKNTPRFSEVAVENFFQIGEVADFTRYKNAVCIVPALAFDVNKKRLGYGGGFYDRFFNAGEFSGLKIGLCYREFMSEFPVEEHDEGVDLIIWK
jgi:5-formyltetrahydrofolate cyclo-ligase